MAKQKNPSFTSPKGRYSWPALVKPDYGTPEFPKEGGVFKVNLVVPENDPAVQAFLAKLQPIQEQAEAEGAQKFGALAVPIRKKLGGLKVNELYSIEYDSKTEEPTGNIIFKFSTKASGVNAKGDEWTRTIPLFDAKGKALKGIAEVGGGTIGKVNFEAVPYFVAGQGTAGVKFYLVACQILDLVTHGERSAGEYGFGEEEGFSGSDPEDESHERAFASQEDSGNPDF